MFRAFTIVPTLQREIHTIHVCLYIYIYNCVYVILFATYLNGERKYLAIRMHVIIIYICVSVVTRSLSCDSTAKRL